MDVVSTAISLANVVRALKNAADDVKESDSNIGDLSDRLTRMEALLNRITEQSNKVLMSATLQSLNRLIEKEDGLRIFLSQHKKKKGIYAFFLKAASVSQTQKTIEKFNHSLDSILQELTANIVVLMHETQNRTRDQVKEAPSVAVDIPKQVLVPVANPLQNYVLACLRCSKTQCECFTLRSSNHPCKDYFCRSPLCIAVADGRTEEVLRLAGHWAKNEHTNEEFWGQPNFDETTSYNKAHPKDTQLRWTAFHEACCQNNVLIVAILYGKGGDLADRSQNGWRTGWGDKPLEIANRWDHREVKRFLAYAEQNDSHDFRKRVLDYAAQLTAML